MFHTQEPLPLQLEYIDRPEVAETFVDSVEKISAEGNTHTVRFEFCVHRIDEPAAGQPPRSGRKYTACRIIMPLAGFVGLATKIERLMSLMEQQGVVAKTTLPMTPAGGKPN
ncbi:MAG: hypothetical protein ACRDGM_06650 [bacterium]